MQQAAAAVRLETSDWSREHRELGIEGVLGQIQNIPSADKLVVCHGGRSHHRHLEHWVNYAPGWEQILLKA